MSIDAMKQALEYLDSPSSKLWPAGTQYNIITALRLAIEQAEKQEPVAWHHPDCEGECIACLIEREVHSAYGNQGLTYLRRHIGAHPCPTCEALARTVMMDQTGRDA